MRLICLILLVSLPAVYTGCANRGLQNYNRAKDAQIDYWDHHSKDWWRGR